jgi:hypothetical protein
MFIVKGKSNSCGFQMTCCVVTLSFFFQKSLERIEKKSAQ